LALLVFDGVNRLWNPAKSNGLFFVHLVDHNLAFHTNIRKR